MLAAVRRASSAQESFARLLVDYNLALPAAEQARRGLRLRAVVHAGEVHHDDNGFFGEEVDVACRLLNAPRLKRSLRTAAGPLALVVSEDIFWAIVKHEYDGIRLDSFEQGVRVQVAGRRRQGWIHLPSEPAVPSLTGAGGGLVAPAVVSAHHGLGFGRHGGHLHGAEVLQGQVASEALRVPGPRGAITVGLG
jgi:hypothetical protein